jgi:hypothetical protein
MDTVVKGMFIFPGGLSGAAQDFITPLRMVHNLKQEFLISEIFLLMFLDHG